MNGSDSDEENAMAYFLPNGIADDSPPKRRCVPFQPPFGYLLSGCSCIASLWFFCTERVRMSPSCA